MKKLFSLDTFMQATRQSIRRFPVTLGFIVVLTCYLLSVVWVDDWFSDRVDFTVCYYLAVGSLLTLVLQLWGEEVKNKRLLGVTHVVAHLMLLADAAYIYTIYDHGGMEVFLAHASVLTALVLSLFVLPFFRERDDVASWNFTQMLVYVGASSFFVGGVMCAGVCLLTEGVDQLFGVGLSDDWMEMWCSLFLFTLPSLLFVGRIPDASGKFNRTPQTSVFFYKSIRFLLLPLLGCYLLVLFVYLAKIVVLWQLPEGWVSKLVSVLTFGSVGVVLGLYPSLHKGTSEADRRVIRVLPLALLPLLVLMTVGIIRRLSDYGITVNRLYILLLNIWYYVVCIGLVLSRARRIWWISVSFALLFLLSAVLPVNVVSYTRRWMFGKVETYIRERYKGALPMSEETYFDFLSGLPRKEALQLNSRLKYLEWELKDKGVHVLVSDTVNWWQASSYITDDMADEAVSGVCYYSNFVSGDIEEVALDTQCVTMLSYSNRMIELPIVKDGDLLVPVYRETSSETPVDTLDIRMDDLRKWSALDNYTPHTLSCRCPGNRFVLTGFTLRGDKDAETMTFTYSGYYFIRHKEENR